MAMIPFSLSWETPMSLPCVHKNHISLPWGGGGDYAAFRIWVDREKACAIPASRGITRCTIIQVF